MMSLMIICFCISFVSVFVLCFAKVINHIDLILNNLCSFRFLGHVLW